MEYKDGYLTDWESLEQIPVSILENIIIRIFRDSYLSQRSREDLLRDYLEQRKRKLDKQFLYTDENMQRLREMNELIKNRSVEAIELGWKVYQEELEAKAADPQHYKDVEIDPQIFISGNLYAQLPDTVLTEKDVEIWRILCSPYNIQLNAFNVLHPTPPFSTRKGQTETSTLENAIKEAIYDGQDTPTSWGDVMCLDRDKTKDIFFVRPFHNLYDFCNFAMADVLRIKDFDIAIEIKDVDR